MDFLRFVTRRVIFGIVVLWLVTIGTFYLFFVSPTDVARSLAGKVATPAQVEGIRHRLGLDQPLAVQYWHYLDNLLHGNLGTSFYSQVPVTTMIKQDLPPTISLIIGGAILWLIAGIGFGVLSATRARSALDRTTTFGVLVGYSMPTFVLGGLLLLIFFAKAGILWMQPGYVAFTQSPITWLGRMILPWITLATVQVAVYSRLTRGSLLDALGEDFVRTARAKGLPERRVIYRHGLRAALIPVVTQLGVDIATLISGAIVTETVFSLGGVGQSVVQAVVRGDLFFILGVVLVTAFAVVVANIVVDIAYSFLDPRIRLS
jgi:peptide/nickel transport system permease protein